MRILPMIICGTGLVLVATAATLALEPGKEARLAAIDGYVTEQADRYDERAYSNRAERRWGAFFSSIKTMEGGIFRDAGFDLPAVLPEAPAGWDVAPYQTAHGLAITGRHIERTGFATTNTNRRLLDFEAALAERTSGTAVTYIRGDRLIALMLRVDKSAIRTAEDTGAVPIIPPRSGETRVGAIDGVAILRSQRIHHNLMTDQREPANHDHYHLPMGGLVTVEVLTNAAPDEVTTLLAGLDMATIQSSLPAPVGEPKS